jgi:hypothetical protein
MACNPQSRFKRLTSFYYNLSQKQYNRAQKLDNRAQKLDNLEKKLNNREHNPKKPKKRENRDNLDCNRDYNHNRNRTRIVEVKTRPKAEIHDSRYSSCISYTSQVRRNARQDLMGNLNNCQL